jgi:hypothetical protein
MLESTLCAVPSFCSTRRDYRFLPSPARKRRSSSIEPGNVSPFGYVDRHRRRHDAQRANRGDPTGLSERTITVSATASGREPVMQWRVTVEGEPCRFLVFGHLVLGEQELAHRSRIEIDARRKRFAFRPDTDHIRGQKYPLAVYHLVTSTPGRSRRSAATNCSTWTDIAEAARTSRSGRARRRNSLLRSSVR